MSLGLLSQGEREEVKPKRRRQGFSFWEASSWGKASRTFLGRPDLTCRCAYREGRGVPVRLTSPSRQCSKCLDTRGRTPLLEGVEVVVVASHIDGAARDGGGGEHLAAGLKLPGHSGKGAGAFSGVDSGAGWVGPKHGSV